MAVEGCGGAVDFGYLEAYAAGDRAVVDEVLALFIEQAAGWGARLAAPDPGWRDVVHTLKGTARGIGAHALGEACARAEAEGEAALQAVRALLQAALTEIAAYQSGRRD